MSDPRKCPVELLPGWPKEWSTRRPVAPFIPDGPSLLPSATLADEVRELKDEIRALRQLLTKRTAGGLYLAWSLDDLEVKLDGTI
jgi:hypothetical protein